MSEQTEPLVQNASDARQVRAAGKKVKQRDMANLDQIGAVVSTRLGRKWLWSKLNQSNVFNTTFDSNPYQSAFNEGWRAAGLSLLTDINLLGPEVLIQIRAEANDDNERGL